MSELGEILGKLIHNQNISEETPVKKGSVNTWFMLNFIKVMLKCTNAKIEYRDDTGFSFVGVPGFSAVPWKVGGNTSAWTEHQDITDDFIVTDVGRTNVTKYLNNESPTIPTYVAWGNDNSTFLATSTSLYSEVTRAQTVNATGAIGVFTVIGQFAPSTTNTMREIGVFNDSSNGDMYFRNVTNDLSVLNQYSVRVTFTFTFTDETDNASSILVNNGLNHFRNYFVSSINVFDYTEWSDGTSALDATDTSLDGSNKQRNQITSTSRTDFKCNKISILTAAQFNSFTMGKMGNFVSAGATNTLVTETLLPQQIKRNTFKVRAESIFEVVSDYDYSNVFPYTFPITLK